MSLHVDILTPGRALFSGETSALTVPGYRGQLQILPQHSGLLTQLVPGVVCVEGEQRLLWAVQAGFLDVGQGHVRILASHGVSIEDIDLDHCQKQYQLLQQQLLAIEVSVAEREQLFEKRTWLEACLALQAKA